MSLDGITPALIGAVGDLLKRQGQPPQVGAGQPPPPAAVNPAPPRVGATPGTFAGPTFNTPKIGAQPAAPTPQPAPAGTGMIGAGPDYAAEYAQHAAQRPPDLDPEAGKPSMLRKIGGVAAASLIGALNPTAGGEIGSMIIHGPRHSLEMEHQQQEQAWERQGADISKEASLADTVSQIHQRDAEATKAGTPPVAKEKTPQEQAYEFAVKFGKNPLEAYGAVRDDGKTPPAAEQPLGQSADSLNAQLEDRWHVLNPGKPLPSQYKVSAQSTKTDYDRLDKALNGLETATGAKAQRDIVNSDRATARADKEEKAGKPTADEQRRSDLSENLNENLNTLEDIVKRRPDLFGSVKGRATSLREWLGSSDPDIATLETIKHQIGMAQISAHGMRSAQGIDGAAESIFNNFKNGPQAMLASINAVRNSVKTFSGDVERARNDSGKKNSNASATSPAPAKSADLGDAAGKPEGSTGTLPDGTKVKVVKGRIIRQ